MSDFLSRLAARSLGAPPAVLPDLPPRFAPEAGTGWSAPSQEGEVAASTTAVVTPPDGVRSTAAPDDGGEPVRAAAPDAGPSGLPPRHAFAAEDPDASPSPEASGWRTGLAAKPPPGARTVVGENAPSRGPFTPSMTAAVEDDLNRTPTAARSRAAGPRDEVEVMEPVRERAGGLGRAEPATSDASPSDPSRRQPAPLEALSELDGAADPQPASSPHVRAADGLRAPLDAAEPPEDVPLPAERPVRRVAARRAESPADDGEGAGRVDTPGELDAAPVIRVSIGRIEVRAATSRAPSPPRPRAVEPQRSTLDDYLRQRARGGAR